MLFCVDRNQYLNQMFNEWENHDRDGLYHDTQILMAYNSNRLEGNSLTENDTRTMFENDITYGNTPDAQAIANHFVAFNEVLSNIDAPLTPDYIKYLHSILMDSTNDSFAPDFILGDYRQSEAWLGAKPVCNWKHIEERMNILLNEYEPYSHSFEEINNFHGLFENIHPFSNGNGRVGRLIHFKECVRNNITPCIVIDNDKEMYYHGLEMFNMNAEPLTKAFRYYQGIYENLLIDKVNTGA